MVTIYNNGVKCYQLLSLSAITDELLFVKDLGQNPYKALFFTQYGTDLENISLVHMTLWETMQCVNHIDACLCTCTAYNTPGFYGSLREC